MIWGYNRGLGGIKKHPLPSLTESGVQIDGENNVAPLRVLGYLDSGGVFQSVGVLKSLPVSATIEVAEVTKKVQTQTNIDFSSTSAQTIIAAPGAGYRIRLTRLGLYSGSEPPVNIELVIKSGSRTIETVKGAGKNVNAVMHPEAQIGAIRKQVLAICQSLGIELNDDFAALNHAVEAAKQ